jgi:hypothetical protein
MLAQKRVVSFFGPWLKPRALEFLRMHLPAHIQFVEHKPAGIFAQVQRDFSRRADANRWGCSDGLKMRSRIESAPKPARRLDRCLRFSLE